MLPSGTVTVNQLWKRFRPDRQPLLLRARFRDLKGQAKTRKLPWTWALRDINFSIEPGHAVGLIGLNGSGKSTLLKILTRVMYPYAGRIETVGRVGALIEVTSGIHPELSGRENIFMYGSLLGLPRREVGQRFDQIVEFAELTQAVDRQTKFYSSGMKMRLGFSVAAFLEPDVLLVDEVLAVGDASFQQRCLDRMRDVIAQGTTLVYVSHDLPTVEAVCTRAVWLRSGMLLEDGPVREVLADYRRSIEAGVETAARGEDELVQVTSTTVTGVEGGAPRTLEPLVVTLELKSKLGTLADVYLGLSDGPGTPVVFVRELLTIPEGGSVVTCTLRDLPVPGGRMFLWLGMNGKHGVELMAWAPVATVDVGGPELVAAPPGIVRIAPTYTAAAWTVE